MRPTSPSRQSHPETGATPLFARRCLPCMPDRRAASVLSFQESFDRFEPHTFFRYNFFSIRASLRIFPGAVSGETCEYLLGTSPHTYHSGRFSFLKNLRTWSCDTKVFHERRLFLLPPLTFVHEVASNTLHFHASLISSHHAIVHTADAQKHVATHAKKARCPDCRSPRRAI